MLSAGQLEEAEEKLRVWQPVLPETEVKTCFRMQSTANTGEPSART